MTAGGPPPPEPNWPYAAAPQYGYYGHPGPYYDGPPGKIRPTGISILLVICTLGIYVFVYNYCVHDEMRRHSGRGIGGGIALLLTFLAGIAMPFVTPSEVGSQYLRKGWPPPVSGWTGLWSVGPLLLGYVAQFFLIFAVPVAISGRSGFADVVTGFVIFVFLWLILVVVGAVIWFVQTNNALNAYWRAVGVQR